MRETNKTGNRITSWRLKRIKDRLIKDLKESALSFGELGKKYGVSRQAIFALSQRRGIKRPKKPKIGIHKTVPSVSP